MWLQAAGECARTHEHLFHQRQHYTNLQRVRKFNKENLQGWRKNLEDRGLPKNKAGEPRAPSCGWSLLHAFSQNSQNVLGLKLQTLSKLYQPCITPLNVCIYHVFVVVVSFVLSNFLKPKKTRKAFTAILAISVCSSFCVLQTCLYWCLLFLMQRKAESSEEEEEKDDEENLRHSLFERVAASVRSLSFR